MRPNAIQFDTAPKQPPLNRANTQRSNSFLTSYLQALQADVDPFRRAEVIERHEGCVAAANSMGLSLADFLQAKAIRVQQGHVAAMSFVAKSKSLSVK